ncbi:glycosyltransferase family 92 protein [Candidatus Neptunichlamydia sp. REUL1]|uniref:glycosyltransferase family 92 protein n=1 Tax=Candidatus Neptunichlamydia sp. REUL1 TaxID=3064277 RepID=UPI002930CB34|nr:glycosyltransferase family 92 protein [Candidatus Neptunochlamydia sp. REUL1]
MIILKKIVIILCFTSIIYAKHSVSILSTFRNEGRFLEEWIEYHRLIGVNHFYLYNHCSTDNYEEVLQKYVDMGIVTLEKNLNQDKPHIKRLPNGFILDVVQHANANHFMESYAKESEWVAHIDIDEFIVIPENFRSILHFLESLPKKKDGYKIAGFFMYWKL